jgi:signal transduction histidine kinase
LQLAVTDAESAQRGFLLTGDAGYLDPYRQSKQQTEDLLKQLSAAYDRQAGPLKAQSEELANLVTTKFTELDVTLAMYEKGRAQALALIRTDFGQRAMDGVRDLTREIRLEETKLIDTQTQEWLRAQRISSVVAAVGSILNILLILTAGALVTRDLKRRAAAAADLESQVSKATTELSELSTHLQQLSEREKSALARELHDELGGLLIAIKMDLAQLKSQIDLTKPDVRARWDRIDATLSAGIALKRRVIEQLRPSLLDNMGLIAALQWQAREICTRANLELVESYPETEPIIGSEGAIAVFRIAQEALTNIVKHAKAKSVELTLTANDGQLLLRIEDDGVGVEPSRLHATGAHGVAGMRHRLKSQGGELRIEASSPSGTKLTAVLPLSHPTLIARPATHPSLAASAH